jgi:hypothetical protein
MKIIKKSFKGYIFTALVVSFLQIAVVAQPQNIGSPVTLDRLLKTLASKQVGTLEMVRVIKTKGANFRVTPAVEQQLITAGARPQLIQAIKNSYRAEQPAAAKNAAATIKADDDLYQRYNLAITQAATPLPGEERLNPSQQMEKIIERIKVATKDDPNRTEGYKVISLFYQGLERFGEAEIYSQKIIDIGGAAAFPVVHDHDGAFDDFCNGVLFVGKNSLSFEATDNNVHFFAPTIYYSAELNPAEMRSEQSKPFSFRITVEEEGERAAGDFAPMMTTGQEQITSMILRLIKKNVAMTK